MISISATKFYCIQLNLKLSLTSFYHFHDVTLQIQFSLTKWSNLNLLVDTSRETPCILHYSKLYLCIYNIFVLILNDGYVLLSHQYFTVSSASERNETTTDDDFLATLNFKLHLLKVNRDTQYWLTTYLPCDFYEPCAPLWPCSAKIQNKAWALLGTRVILELIKITLVSCLLYEYY